MKRELSYLALGKVAFVMDSILVFQNSKTLHACFYFLLDVKDELNDAMGVPFFYGLVEGLFIGMEP